VEHIAPAIKSSIQHAEKELAEHEANIGRKLQQGLTPTYQELADALERIDAIVSEPWQTVGHLKSVKDSDQLREVHQEMQPLVVAFGTRISQSEAFYRGWCALRDDQDAWVPLLNQQRRVAELELLGAKLAGIGLQGEQKERFNEIQKRLAHLSTTFNNNVLDATKAFKHRLDRKEEIDGLPASALAMMAASARKNGDPNATAEDGPWVVTLDIPCYMAVMKYATSAAVREKVYRAYITRASEHGLGGDNAPVINEILKLRAEKATLLGYSSFAEVSLAKKMATLDGAHQLMEDLRSASMDAAKAEHEELEKYAGKQLKLWDNAFYAERLKQEKFSYDEENVRQYLSLDNVLQGLFGVISRLFDVEIFERSPKELGAQVWDKEVRTFEVRREGKACAYFYLDAYTRPGEKKGGAWMRGEKQRSRALAQPGQEVQLPVAHMVCNQSAPVTNPDGTVTPSLMLFREVETVFHECGHALQHMLTQVDEGHVSGISGVEWDAVEQPSQFMEYWAYDVPTLKSMAKHWKTGDSMPDDLIEKIRAAKTYRAAWMMTRQLKFSLTDLALHDASFVPGAVGGKTIWDVEREIDAKTSVTPPLPEDRFLCGFAHIFAGGYAAGYYSYKWAEVLSADGFAAFEEGGLEDEAAMRWLGRRYRDTALAAGGSQPAADVFEAFRGRAPKADALLRHHGLTAGDAAAAPRARL
jgi:oligopeptidase A